MAGRCAVGDRHRPGRHQGRHRHRARGRGRCWVGRGCRRRGWRPQRRWPRWAARAGARLPAAADAIAVGMAMPAIVDDDGRVDVGGAVACPTGTDADAGGAADGGVRAAGARRPSTATRRPRARRCSGAAPAAAAWSTIIVGTGMGAGVWVRRARHPGRGRGRRRGGPRSLADRARTASPRPRNRSRPGPGILALARRLDPGDRLRRHAARSSVPPGPVIRPRAPAIAEAAAIAGAVAGSAVNVIAPGGRRVDRGRGLPGRLLRRRHPRGAGMQPTVRRRADAVRQITTRCRIESHGCRGRCAGRGHREDTGMTAASYFNVARALTDHIEQVSGDSIRQAAEADGRRRRQGRPHQPVRQRPLDPAGDGRVPALRLLSRVPAADGRAPLVAQRAGHRWRARAAVAGAHRGLHRQLPGQLPVRRRATRSSSTATAA